MEFVQDLVKIVGNIDTPITLIAFIALLTTIVLVKYYSINIKIIRSVKSKPQNEALEILQRAFTNKDLSSLTKKQRFDLILTTVNNRLKTTKLLISFSVLVTLIMLSYFAYSFHMEGEKMSGRKQFFYAEFTKTFDRYYTCLENLVIRGDAALPGYNIVCHSPQKKSYIEAINDYNQIFNKLDTTKEAMESKIKLLWGEQEFEAVNSLVENTNDIHQSSILADINPLITQINSLKVYCDSAGVVKQKVLDGFIQHYEEANKRLQRKVQSIDQQYEKFKEDLKQSI